MSPQNFFEGLGGEKQHEYEQEIGRRCGEASVKESADRWGRYTPEQKQKIKTTCPSFCTRPYSFTAQAKRATPRKMQNSKRKGILRVESRVNHRLARPNI